MRISCLVFTHYWYLRLFQKYYAVQYICICIYIYSIYILMIFISGWWFGTWLLWFSIQLGMSSSQVTVSHFFLFWIHDLGSSWYVLEWSYIQQCPNQPLNEDSTNPITWPWPVTSCFEWEIQSANIEGLWSVHKDDIVGYDGILIPKSDAPTIDGQHLPLKKWEHWWLIGLVPFGGWLNHDLSR
jgi:hypothetical protein